MLVVACGLFAMFFFNTLFVQRVLAYTPIEAGLAFLPFTAGIIIGSVLSQQLIPRLGAREVPIIGLVTAVVGMLLFLRLSPDSTYVADILPGIMLASIGMGLTFVPLTLIATSGDSCRRRRARIGAVQHLAADRWRARPRAALHVRRQQDRRRALLDGWQADRGGDGAGARRRLPCRLDRVRGLPRRRGRAALRTTAPGRRPRRGARRGRAGHHVELASSARVGCGREDRAVSDRAVLRRPRVHGAVHALVERRRIVHDRRPARPRA